MTKKRKAGAALGMTKAEIDRKYPSLETLLYRAVCYHCDREFVDQPVLKRHMMDTHYLCMHGTCHKKLTNPHSLKTHTSQVHHVELERIPNSLPGRDDPDSPLFVMLNFPQDILEQRKARIIREYQAKCHEYMQEHGRPMPNSQQPSAQSSAPKKPKIDTGPKETIEEDVARAKALIQARLAEITAKKNATASSGPEVKQEIKSESPANSTSNSTPNAPMELPQTHSTGTSSPAQAADFQQPLPHQSPAAGTVTSGSIAGTYPHSSVIVHPPASTSIYTASHSSPSDTPWGYPVYGPPFPPLPQANLGYGAVPNSQYVPGFINSVYPPASQYGFQSHPASSIPSSNANAPSIFSMPAANLPPRPKFSTSSAANNEIPINSHNSQSHGGPGVAHRFPGALGAKHEDLGFSNKSLSLKTEGEAVKQETYKGPAINKDETNVRQLVEDLSSADMQEQYRLRREQALKQESESLKPNAPSSKPDVEEAAQQTTVDMTPALKPGELIKLSLEGDNWEQKRANLAKYQPETLIDRSLASSHGQHALLGVST